MFLNGQLNLQIYADSTETVYPLLNQPNLQVAWTNSAVTGTESLYFSLPASASQAISLNNMTGVTQWYIYSDASDLTLNINGTAGFVFKAGVPGYIPITLSSLTMGNLSSTVDTNVTLLLIKG